MAIPQVQPRARWPLRRPCSRWWHRTVLSLITGAVELIESCGRRENLDDEILGFLGLSGVPSGFQTNPHESHIESPCRMLRSGKDQSVSSDRALESPWRGCEAGPGSQRCLELIELTMISQRGDKWVCLKIGYIPNYSHLIGIMIINHWV